MDKKKSLLYQCSDGNIVDMYLQNMSRLMRKLFKELGANRKGGSDGPNLNIDVGDRVATDESDMTEVFISYFVNVASNLKEPIVQ